MADHVADADAPGTARLAARNHLGLAERWGVFDDDAPPVASLADGEPTVLDCAGLEPAPAGAVVRAVADGLYAAREAGGLDRLPWLFVDEAHAFFDGVAAPALRRLLTRGRAPGVSLVAATQRPGALPAVALSQADLLVAHRLTAADDVAALVSAAPDTLADRIRDRVPTAVGDAAVVDDVTESVHAVAIRERRTPHRGESPRASRLSGSSGGGAPAPDRDRGTNGDPDRGGGDGPARSETAE
jgi:hypothetical protein